MQKHNQHFKTAVFHNKFTLCQIKPNISILKTKFTSLKQYLFRLLTSRNAKETQTDQSIPRVFLLCLKRNDSQTCKRGSCNFSSVYVIGATCFDECFSFYVITKRHYFSWKFIITLRLFKWHFATFFEASVLKEVRILCGISTITTWC